MLRCKGLTKVSSCRKGEGGIIKALHIRTLRDLIVEGSKYKGSLVYQKIQALNGDGKTDRRERGRLVGDWNSCIGMVGGAHNRGRDA